MIFQSEKIKVGCDGNGEFFVKIAIPRENALNLENCIGLHDIEIKKHRNKRSLNANALLWKVLDSIAEILRADKEEIYIQMLRSYGVQKFLVVKPDAAESVAELFRAVDDLGYVLVNGKKGKQLRCIVGSSQYNTAEMARLLEGTIEESKELGGFVPDEKDVGASLKLWEKERG